MGMCLFLPFFDTKLSQQSAALKIPSHLRKCVNGICVPTKWGTKPCTGRINLYLSIYPSIHLAIFYPSIFLSIQNIRVAIMLQSTSIFGVFEKNTVNTSVATTLLRLQASISIPDIKDTLICISGCGPPSVDWGDDWGGDASSVMAKKDAADVEIVAFLCPSSTKTLEIMWKTQTNDHPPVMLWKRLRRYRRYQEIWSRHGYLLHTFEILRRFQGFHKFHTDPYEFHWCCQWLPGLLLAQWSCP